MNQIAISAKGLTRYFDDRCVVRQANFELARGTVTGLLGLNGAGKSTLIKMLMGLLAPTRGSCSILGVDSQAMSAEHRVKIGYTIEGHFLYRSMTVRDLERLQCDSFPNWSSLSFQSTIERFGIRPNARARTLSRGQRAGVAVALTLSSRPELLILDDPALGLDPVSRRALNETIIAFMEPGDKTVLLSSHLLDDIERVTDHVLIMVDGRIIVDSSVTHFLSRLSTWSCDRVDPTERLPFVPGLVHARSCGNQLMLVVVDADEETEAALRRIGGNSLRRLDDSFDESVIAYLSRSRSSQAFLLDSASA